MFQLRVLHHIACVAYVSDRFRQQSSGADIAVCSKSATFLRTGKSAERPILSEDNIEHNVQSIQALLQQLLSQKAEQGIPEPVLLNNLDWFGTMPLLTFLRQV